MYYLGELQRIHQGILCNIFDWDVHQVKTDIIRMVYIVRLYECQNLQLKYITCL